MFRSMIGILSITFSRYLSFLFHDPATTEIYTLSLHDALPIYLCAVRLEPSGATSIAETPRVPSPVPPAKLRRPRSEEHTSELQSRVDLVCRLLLEKKKLRTAPLSKRPRPRRPSIAYLLRAVAR